MLNEKDRQIVEFNEQFVKGGDQNISLMEDRIHFDEEPIPTFNIIKPMLEDRGIIDDYKIYLPNGLVSKLVPLQKKYNNCLKRLLRYENSLEEQNYLMCESFGILLTIDNYILKYKGE